MAQNNQNRNARGTPADVETMRNMKIPPVSFNIVGLSPVECTYTPLVSDVINFMKGVCKDFFGTNGVYDVTINSDMNAAAVAMFVWFKWDSPHIADTSLIDDDKSVINRPIPKLSKELRQFMEAYCRPENQKVLSEGTRDGVHRFTEFKCVKVDLYRVFLAMFDQKGRWYNEVFGNTGDRTPYTQVNVNTVWDKKNGNVTGFIVKKCDGRRGGRKPLPPMGAFRARRNDD